MTSRPASSENGPARKYYAVTESGRQAYDTGSESWQRIQGAVDALMGVALASPLVIRGAAHDPCRRGR